MKYKKHIISAIVAGLITLGVWAFNHQPQVKKALTFGAFGDPFISIQLAASPSNGNCLTTDGTNNSWSSSCGSGGSGSGTWATTTSQVSGVNINYPLEDDDVVTIGSSASTTAEYYFDPNTQGAQIGRAMTASTTILGRLNLAYSSSTIYSSFKVASTTSLYLGENDGCLEVAGKIVFSTGSSCVTTSPGTFIDNEIVDGSDVTYTLQYTPIADTVHVYAMGQRLELGTDYTISGDVITPLYSWDTGDIIADYRTNDPGAPI